MGVHPRHAMSDLAERAESMTAAELAAYYGCDPSAVCKRLKAAGITARQLTRQERVEKSAASLERGRARAAITNRYRHWQATTIRKAMVSDVELAADHLRKCAPVYRCTETGMANQGGKHWRYGSLILSDDQIIEKAKGKGWVR